MAFAQNNKIRSSQGDYGVPIPVELVSCCGCCDIDLLDTDVLRLEVQKGDDVLVTREVTWEELRENNSVLALELTKEESDSMPVGVYVWTVLLFRAKDMRATLIRSVWEVIM